MRGHLLHLKGYGVDPCNTISDQTRKELARECEAAENWKSRQALEVKRMHEFMSLPSGSNLKKKKKGNCWNIFNVVEKERDEVDKKMACMIMLLFYHFL